MDVMLRIHEAVSEEIICFLLFEAEEMLIALEVRAT